MKLKINTYGILIDVTGNPALTLLLGTSKEAIFESNIVKFVVNELQDCVEIIDTEGDEYFLSWTQITEINGTPTTFTNVEDSFDTIANLLMGA